ncbi:hypothetical protein EG68_04173 [Paragonimus skrjabini miyazakii]|uniref:Uncharacterized protein n=1 Tax=Paragonimus skrjabini miyazakii TaxID=59628 RepID=A0A8S9YWI8_9TREM|nr:hypothetical protein EG68_04173 [Paragonimus skrjabini miyazakii]
MHHELTHIAGVCLTPAEYLAHTLSHFYRFWTSRQPRIEGKWFYLGRSQRRVHASIYTTRSVSFILGGASPNETARTRHATSIGRPSSDGMVVGGGVVPLSQSDCRSAVEHLCAVWTVFFLALPSDAPCNVICSDSLIEIYDCHI